MGNIGDAYKVGTRTRGKQGQEGNEDKREMRMRGKTYRVGIRSELTGIVSEQGSDSSETNTQHGPTRSILITFVIHPQFAQSNTHQVHVEYFQKVPTTEPVEGGLDLPTGSI